MAAAVWMLINLAGAALIGFSTLFGFHRRVVLACLSVAIGASALAANYLVVLPALTDTEKDRLRTALAVQEKEGARVRGELGSMEEAHRRALEGIRALEGAHRAQLDRIGSELADVRSQLSREPYGLVAPVSRTTAPRAASAYDQVLAAAQELREFAPRPARPPPQAEPRQDQLRELIQLKEQMAARLSTPSYDVEVYPDRELVGGRRGRYYVVDLKDASSGVRYYFDGGRYTLSRGTTEFRSSLNSFIADVLSKIDGNARYDLFVRGSADRKPYQGRLEPGFEFRQVRYLRSAGQDKYQLLYGERRIDSVVRNDDLPDLRASFMSRLVAESYPVKPPIVLEGGVSAKHDTKDRNVELILFVDW